MAIDIEVATKDCTALTDAELAEMADLSAEERSGWEVGFLSKQREEWVLVTQVREQGRLLGYALATLERIGGTPSLLIGVAAFGRGRSATPALDAASADVAVAYPDETLQEAIAKMLKRNIGRLPVVERANARKVIGYLGRADILGARLRLQEEEELREQGPIIRSRTG